MYFATVEFQGYDITAKVKIEMMHKVTKITLHKKKLVRLSFYPFIKDTQMETAASKKN